MKTKDIMTTTVITVAPETSVAEVARLLLDKHISAVPVLDVSGGLVGMVSEGDLMRRAEGAEHHQDSWWLRLVSNPSERASDYVKSRGRSAGDVMTRDVVSVTEDTPVGQVAHLQETKQIKRVPVLRDGKLVGIVSRADLLRAVVARRDIQPATSSAADQTIRRRILEKFNQSDWAPASRLSVLVDDGIAQIWGLVDSKEQRDALRVAAENVAGVRGVEIHASVFPAYYWGE